MEQPTNQEVLDALIDFRDAIFANMATRTEMQDGFTAVRAEMQDGFVKVDARFDRLERRVGVLENRVDDGFGRVEKQLDSLEAEVGRLQRRRH